MSSNKSHAIEFAVLPRDARLPTNMLALATSAALEFCPVASVSRRVRADHIATLIDATLVEAGR
jgi:hypothetical protein